jgi:hypothetical protein
MLTTIVLIVSVVWCYALLDYAEYHSVVPCHAALDYAEYCCAEYHSTVFC